MLLFGGIHISLATDDEFGAARGAVAPDFRVITVVAGSKNLFRNRAPAGLTYTWLLEIGREAVILGNARRIDSSNPGAWTDHSK